jgi:hypothetical protein
MDYLVTITGDGLGPFNIYYDSISVGTKLLTGVSRQDMLNGKLVTGIPSTAVSIIVYNTDADCQNYVTYYLATPTPTPTTAPTPTPTPTTIVVDCTISSGTVSINTVASTPTPTSAPPTPTPTTVPPTPTPTPTDTLVLRRAQVVETSVSVSSTFQITNNTVGGTTDNISGGTAGSPKYGKNDAYVTAVPSSVTYRIRKTATSTTALDGGFILVYVNGSIQASQLFSQNDVIDYYLTVTIDSSSTVNIEIQEG